MSTLMKFLFGVVAALAVLILAHIDPALAQEAAAEAPPAAPPAPTLDHGDTAWMLTSTALVLMMTIPGLALFYGGMVRKKNVLATVMQSFATTCIVTVVWMVIAYSLAFTDGGSMNAYIGGMSRFLLKGMEVDTLKGTIPESVFMCFQMTFAIITPALITGAFADRMKFSALVIFMVLWQILIYAPIARGARLRRRNGRAYQRRCRWPGLRPLYRQALRLRLREYGAAQSGVQHDRRLAAVGRLVRL
jgi:Amt family ammonium transporter